MEISQAGQGYKNSRQSVAGGRQSVISGRRSAVGSSGFTLLEIIIVMLIVGMMAAIIAPSVRSGIESIRFRTSIKQLLATLRYCRSKAISTKEQKVVQIDMDEGSYTILGLVLPNDEDAQSSSSKILPEGVFFIEWETPYESETADIQTITFFPKGNATGGILHIEDRKGRLYKIVIDRITGRAKIVGEDEEV